MSGSGSVVHLDDRSTMYCIHTHPTTCPKKNSSLCIEEMKNELMGIAGIHAPKLSIIPQYIII